MSAPADIDLTIVQQIQELTIDPQAIDVAVTPAVIEIMPVSGIYNPPIYDGDVAMAAMINPLKLDMTALLALVHEDIDPTFTQINNDIDYLEAQVASIQGQLNTGVTIATDQTITGAKIFQGAVTVPVSSNFASQEAVCMSVLATRVPGRIYVGTAAPAAGTGVNGDFYFQYTP